MDLARQLESLGPFGMGNPGPRLLVPSGRLTEVRPLGEEGKHSRFQLESGAGRAVGVAFGMNGEISRRRGPAPGPLGGIGGGPLERRRAAPRGRPRALSAGANRLRRLRERRFCGEGCPAPDAEWWDRLERRDGGSGRWPPRFAARRKGGGGAPPRVHRPTRGCRRGIAGRADLERGIGARDLRGRGAPRQACLLGRRPAPLRCGPAADRLLPLRERRTGPRAGDATRRRARARRLDVDRPAARVLLATSGTSCWSIRRPASRWRGWPSSPNVRRRPQTTPPGTSASRGGLRSSSSPRVSWTANGTCGRRSGRSGAASARQGEGRGCGPPRSARGRLPLSADTRDRCPLRTGARRARTVRMATEWRRRRAAGLILGEDRSGAIAGLRGVHRQTPGGHPIPAKQSTTGVASTQGRGAPRRRQAARRGTPRAHPRRRARGPLAHAARRLDHPRAHPRPAGTAGRPLRSHRGAQVAIRRADRPRGDRARLRLRLREPRRPGAQVRRGLHHPPARRRADLRRPAARHRDPLRGPAPRHRRGHQRQPRGGPRALRRRDRPARRRRHQADRDHLPEPRRAAGRELPQDDGGDGHRRQGDPDQAGRPPPQHAHARRAAQAEAAGEGARDARDLRPARAPARDPRDQVGARGPRLRDAAPAQVRGDQGARRPAAGRARALRRRTRASSSPRS